MLMTMRFAILVVKMITVDTTGRVESNMPQNSNDLPYDGQYRTGRILPSR